MSCGGSISTNDPVEFRNRAGPGRPARSAPTSALAQLRPAAARAGPGPPRRGRTAEDADTIRPEHQVQSWFLGFLISSTDFWEPPDF